MHTVAIIIIAFGISMLNVPRSFAESTAPTYAIGLGLDISSGKFGAASRSTFVTAPLIIDWFPTGRLDLELTVPLVYQRTGAAGHAVLGTGAQSTPKSVARGSMMGGGSGGGMFAGDYGLGDITLTSGYVLVQDGETSPRIRPTVYLKFPTASESKGLGTGQFDFGAGVAVSKWLGNWQPFTEGRYIIQGEANDGTGAKDFITADAGIAYSWSGRFVTLGYARFGSPLFSGLSAPLEARLKLAWRFTDRITADAYVLKGFSDGSPDYGGGLSIFTEF